MHKDDDKETSAEELRAWQRDQRGEMFWAAIRAMANDAMSKMRVAIKQEQFHKATQYQSHLETLEEVLQLPDLIIDADDKEKA